MEQQHKEDVQSDIETVFSIPEGQLEEIREKAKQRAEQARHNWKQRGTRIVCTACPFNHAINVGIDKRLIDIKDNLPVLELRSKA